ncbi:hypothetical protein JCM21900_006352 [Sporobolomyces salmonicolor]
MSFYDRFRTPGGDLASFFRSLAGPSRPYNFQRYDASADHYEWEVLRARQGGSKRLDFFDHDLNGPKGATVVLQALERSPGATSMSLSQNNLGDDGVRELLVGLKRLRSKDIGAHLQELNLSGCRLSDVALHLVTLHLLLPSPHPPSLTHLYLTGNNLTLGSQSSLASLPEFLGNALSSPSCALRCFSLTNNPSIGTSGVVALLSHIRLGAGPSQLSQLHLSVCGLTPDCAEPLAQWLEDPEGGGRLQVLAVNGCSLGEAGIRRIARSIISGKASSLLHLECLANEEGDAERWADVVAALEAQSTDEDRDNWKTKLEQAKERNKKAFKETRLAALALVAPARILFGGNAREGGPDIDEIREKVEAMHNTDTLTSYLFPSESFPFLRLPIELQVHVLRCLMLLKPSTIAHLYPPSNTAQPTFAPPPDSSPILSAPLTEAQFLRIVAHCASRPTLTTERRIDQAAGRAPSLNPTARWPGVGAAGQGDPEGGDGWEEWFLRTVGCDRFEQAGAM